jgi:tRNA 2-selenouridine synthase
MKIEFLIENIKDFTVIDVRSPSEYEKGHIPSAINIPLFSDEERKIIGTIYKKEGKTAAIEKGLSFVNLSNITMKVKDLNPKQIALYCFRGGMRSFSVGWLLELLGYKVLILEGGYKSFRRWVLWQFEKQYELKVIGGYTGVGKTLIIKKLNAIDLEEIACHKGSVFGNLEKKQPTQEQFENLLSIELFKFKDKKIFLEDESRFIGKIAIPNAFYNQMQTASIIILKDLVENRIQKCIFEYKNHSKEFLKEGIKKLEKKLGTLATKQVINFVDEDKYIEVCKILFFYYDKRYDFSLSKKDAKKVSYLDIYNKSEDQISSYLFSWKG